MPTACQLQQLCGHLRTGPNDAMMRCDRGDRRLLRFFFHGDLETRTGDFMGFKQEKWRLKYIDVIGLNQ